MNHALSTILLLLCCLPFRAIGQIAPCDRPEAPEKEANKLWAGPQKATYYAGQTITFRVTSNQSGDVKYTIRESKRSPILEEGTFHLAANQEKQITYKLNQPGFLELTVQQNWRDYRAGVAIAPCDIEGPSARPADFQHFWDSLQQVSRALPLNVKLSYRSDKSSDSQKSYKLEMDNIDGKKIYGWVSVPNCAGPFPGILLLPSYGRGKIGPAWHFADEGAIAIALSVHSYDCEQEVPKEIAYRPTDHFIDRQTNYFKASIMGCLRAIDYLFTREDFNGEDLAVTGVSQGGGLSIITAGLDPRVKLLVQSQAAFCDHEAAMYDHPSGFPYWIKTGRDLGRTENDVLVETAYYDAVYFAEQFQGKSIHVVGYRDDVCPPATVFAAINRMGGSKQLVHGVNLGHESYPEFWSIRRDFFVEHLPTVSYPDCPAPDETEPDDSEPDNNEPDDPKPDETDPPHDPFNQPPSIAGVQISPNPLTSQGTIFLDLPTSETVDITLWDSYGRLIRTLAHTRLKAGAHQLLWRDVPASSGLYFVKIRIGAEEVVRRVVIAR